MKFTDKFIRVPIQVYDRKLYDSTGVEDNEDSWMKFNPTEISSYRPSWDAADEKKQEIVSLTLRNGGTTLVYLSINEFEDLLNAAYK